MDGHDLELLSLVTRRLLARPCGVVWMPYDYTFDGFSYPEKLVSIFSHLQPTPSLWWSKIRKNCLKSPEIQPSAIHKISYMKVNKLLLYNGYFSNGLSYKNKCLPSILKKYLRKWKDQVFKTVKS